MESEIIGSQKMVQTHLFHQWCTNLFEVTKFIEDELQTDSHHCRWFYIALWELFSSGERYVDEQLSYEYNSDCEYLIVTKYYITKLKELYDDTDYFMLQYYRHSSAHIFQSEYSLIDKKKEPKANTRTSSFFAKDGTKSCKLTQDEIRQKAKTVIDDYGEQVYKSSMISRTYSLINKCREDLNIILSNLNEL
ncbi:MAG: hypothetical protein HDR85_00745 [Bacteroides sp.]|nr:hypothetical protein [Bacteroides sp.]